MVTESRLTELHPLDLRRIPTNLRPNEYKLGDEFKPFHPSASHVPPDYRDGWNRCWLAAQIERSQYEALLRQARGALREVADGYAESTPATAPEFDWVTWYAKATAALSALNARLGDSNQEKSDASK